MWKFLYFDDSFETKLMREIWQTNNLLNICKKQNRKVKKVGKIIYYKSAKLSRPYVHQLYL